MNKFLSPVKLVGLTILDNNQQLLGVDWMKSLRRWQNTKSHYKAETLYSTSNIVQVMK